MAFLLGGWFDWVVDNRYDDRLIIHPAATVKGMRCREGDSRITLALGP